jgi:hypothetical protein
MMNRRFATVGMAALAVAAVCIFTVYPSKAQQRPNKAAIAQQKPTPRMPDGHPDLSGFYGVAVAGVNGYGAAPTGSAEASGIVRAKDGSIFFDYAGAEGGGGHPDDGGRVEQAPNQPPYRPEYMAKVQAIAKTVYGTITHLDPWLECKPAGVPRAGVGGMIHVVANSKFIAILYENNPGPQFRLIYTDGRQHPKDLDTSFMGHSIGHWEGDTLVVDTVGLNDETWYTQTGGANKLTSIHSDKEHVIEKFTRKGDDLAYDVTVEDPVMLSKPWVWQTRHTQIGPSDDYIQPQACNTNDKAHIIEESDKDKFQCNWCQKDADSIYGEGAADRDREAKKARDAQGNAPRPGAE